MFTIKKRPTDTLDPKQTIHRQWKSVSRNIKSVDRQQVATLLDKENREIALTFRGEDAATVMDTIDELLKRDQLPHATKSRAFKLMRRLAGASRQVPKSYIVGRFTWHTVEKEVVARGGCADIRKGRLKGLDVAVKTIRVSLQDRNNISEIHERFCKECVVWMNMSHPNIHQLIAVKMKPRAGEFSMIAKMMKNGNILNYIEKNQANRIQLLEDVASGLEYLHKSGIIHGDLKGPNILINNESPSRACIADFGLSTIVPSNSFGPSAMGIGGTPGYIAPELFLEGAQASKEADMYAFGMVIYEVITGTRPFGSRRLVELHMLTLLGSRPPIPDDPLAIGFGEGTCELAEACWDRDPEQRPTARQALEHFRSAVKTSSVVGAGPKILLHEPTYSKPEDSSKNLPNPFFRSSTDYSSGI